MKELVEFIVKELVSKPDAVVVEETRQDGGINLILNVDPEDMGLIIGKKGQTIRAIRKLLTVRAMAENVRVNLQLADPGRAENEGAEDEEETNEAETPVEATDEDSAA